MTGSHFAVLPLLFIFSAAHASQRRTFDSLQDSIQSACLANIAPSTCPNDAAVYRRRRDASCNCRRRASASEIYYDAYFNVKSNSVSSSDEFWDYKSGGLVPDLLSSSSEAYDAGFCVSETRRRAGYVIADKSTMQLSTAAILDVNPGVYRFSSPIDIPAGCNLTVRGAEGVEFTGLPSIGSTSDTRLFTVSGWLTLLNVTSYGGRGSGGLVLVAENGRLTAESSTFRDTNVTGEGAAVFGATNSFVSLLNCNFSNLKAEGSSDSSTPPYGDGGAIYLNRYSTITVRNCMFSDLSAGRFGGNSAPPHLVCF